MSIKAARIPTAIWTNEHFVALTPETQWTYLMLRTQRTISPAGVLPLSMARWAALAPDATVPGIRDSLLDLAASHFAVVDFDDEEVYVRGHIRDDLGSKQRQGVALALRGVQSPAILAAVTAELEAIDLRQRMVGQGDPAVARIRLGVYRRSDYRCVHCDWRPSVPEGYDGGLALCEHRTDAVSGRPVVRVLELDHIFPESLGGRFTIDNLQALCNSCNASKGARI